MPLDALLVINDLNDRSPSETGDVQPSDALLVINSLNDGDASSDGKVSPSDALVVINDINRTNQSESDDAFDFIPADGRDVGSDETSDDLMADTEATKDLSGLEELTRSSDLEAAADSDAFTDTAVIDAFAFDI